MKTYGWRFKVPYGGLILHKRKDHKKKEKWVIQIGDDKPFEEEPLSRGEMLALMTFPNHRGGMQIASEEVAMMFAEFRYKPQASEGHFGINGSFMFVK